MKLEPERTRLFRDDTGIKIATDGIFCHVTRIARAFPRTNPDHYIGFMDNSGHEIGMIEDPARLDRESFLVLEEELKVRYFIPIIEEITSVVPSAEGSQWTVLTDDGEYTFKIQNRDALDGSEPPSILVRDINRRRYLIENVWELEPESRECIAHLLPDKVVKDKYRKGISMYSRRGGSSSGRGSSRGFSGGSMMSFR